MIYKTTSYKQVVTKVQRDFNLTGGNWVAATPEWIGECLSEIGNHAHLERLSCELEVVNHRVPYPCNLESTLAIEYNGFNLKKGGSLRAGSFGKPYVSEDGFYGGVFPLVDPDTNVSTDQDVVSTGRYTENYYMENPDYIITSFECGTITLHYQGYKLDEDGMPVVPDSSEHREALAFYILYKYLSRGNQHKVWGVRDAYEMWVKYKAKAQNMAKFPDIQSMERFTNMWVRMKADHFLNSKFFESSEHHQQNFNV